MKLKELFASQLNSGRVKRVSGSLDFEVSGLATDSRKINKNSLFIAMKGFSQDSHQFIGKAIESGAIGLLVEDLSQIPHGFHGAVFVAQNMRTLLSELSDRWNDSPSQKLFCVAITGTNGKTTTSHMVEWLLEEKSPCAVIGTIDHHFKKRVWPTELTTPGPVELQERLNDFVKAGAQSLSIEISSHALVQGRADHIALDVGVFTNLTRDHLDFHQTFEEYFSAKAKLFRDILKHSTKRNKTAVINSDDPYGKRLADELSSAEMGLITYGMNSADLRFRVLKENFSGTEFECRFKNEKKIIFLSHPCRHNVYNALATIGVGVGYGMTFAECSERISKFPGVKGRLEPVLNSKGIHIFIDYAHTDDALRSVLASLVDVKKQDTHCQRIITVFGCGGDRDKGKRPMMAQVAFKYSDHVIVTSDNPRTENPDKIIDDIMTGVSDSDKLKCTRLVDRKIAIKRALEIAQNGDVILIAGKGHEDYQVVGKERIHFSDREVVESYL